MKKYEKYQPSAVEWLDKVPAHWKSIKLKFLFEGWMGGSWGNDPTGDENDLICVRVADFDFGNRTLKRKDFTVRNFTPSEQASRLLQKGDLILEKSGGGEKTPVGRVVKFDLDEPAICSNFTNRLIPKAAFDSDFLIYLFFALYNNGVTVSHINQTTGIQNLQVGSFLDETIFIPTSLPEQRAIAAYLDHKTAQLDTLLAQKEALLQKLYQKRQALIDEAVTQGLDRAAPRRPSGAGWLGDVPAHWELKKLKYCVQLNSNEMEDDGNGLRVALENIESKTGCYISTETAPFEGPGNSFKSGDVLFSKLRPYLAKALLAPQNGIAVGEILVLSPMEETLHSAFLLNRVLSPGFIEEVDSSTYGSKMPRASWNFIGEMKIPVPSLKEQQAIVDFIEVKTSKINEATAAIHAQIQTLKAYRQSLISEVVTGKIDVRPAVLAPEADLPLWQQ